ncbi:MAG: hypothetical protein AB7R55_14885 [Gemmatimonadales bacterium]
MIPILTGPNRPKERLVSATPFGIACACLAVSLIPATVDAQRPESPGPITITVVATRSELGQVTPIINRINGRLSRDRTLVDTLDDLADAGKNEDMAALVAREAGVSRAMVHVQRAMGGGGDGQGSGFHQAALWTTVTSSLPLNPWSISYRGTKWSWCVGTTCPTK